MIIVAHLKFIRAMIFIIDCQVLKIQCDVIGGTGIKIPIWINCFRGTGVLSNVDLMNLRIAGIGLARG